jgi:hypothetical protein
VTSGLAGATVFFFVEAWLTNSTVATMAPATTTRLVIQRPQ